MSIAVRFPTAGGAAPASPAPGSVAGVDELLAGLAVEPTGGPLVFGDERVRDFLTAFSRRLLRPDLARRHPELGSLGFFLRRGEIARAVARLGDGTAGSYRSPRGLVIHFPPANVDTIFVYSWALSALAGNRNIVRISPRAADAAASVLAALNDVVADAHPAIAQTQRMVTYDRDDAVTAALSAACDLRVIWGGDASVNAIRRHQLPPLARDLTFPDRSSLAAVNAAGWHAASADARRAAVDGFSNDVYWFDQAACSSPRTIIWVGEAAACDSARAEFESLLTDVVDARGWRVDAAMAVEKRVATYGMAADGAASRVTFAGNAIANVDLADRPAGSDGPGQPLPRRWLGAGTICHRRVGSLTEIAPLIERKDQTLSQFGFALGELDEFVRAVAGRGIDRIVGFGSALTFASVWDGYDLLHEFARITTIQS